MYVSMQMCSTSRMCLGITVKPSAHHSVPASARNCSSPLADCAFSRILASALVRCAFSRISKSGTFTCRTLALSVLLLIKLNLVQSYIATSRNAKSEVFFWKKEILRLCATTNESQFKKFKLPEVWSGTLRRSLN